MNIKKNRIKLEKEDWKLGLGVGGGCWCV